MVKKKNSPRQDHSHKISSIVKIYSFTALPNPSEQLVKQLEKLFYKFLWNLGPDRISRNVIIQDVKEIRMIKINKFIESLKITWLHGILISSNECSWDRLSHVDFRKLVIFGDGYANLCASNLSNPFWIDVLHVNSWKAFLKCNPASQLEIVFNSPIWFNSEMQHGEKFFIKNWYEKGIWNIVNLINDNGGFYDFNQFKSLFNV